MKSAGTPPFSRKDFDEETNMSMTAECPRCQTRYVDIPDEFEGRTAVCKKCGERFALRPASGDDASFIRVICHSCGASSPKVKRELAGRRAKCSKCGASLVIGETPAAQPKAAISEAVAPPRPVSKGANGGDDVFEGWHFSDETVPDGGWQVGATVMDLYEVKELLGRGGFGTVYRLRHLGWDMDLAVKTPNPAALAAMGGAPNLRTEAETWVNLGMHPNIVNCCYVREIERAPCIFVEYVGGGSLRTWIHSGKLNDLETILDIAIQFARGLHYAHEQGLVHQDVKPDNIMMTSEGVAKVTDFGLAKAKGIPATGGPAGPGRSILMTAAGCTPAYASPEQLSGGKVSRKSDIWSFGLSVLEMFTGGVTWPVGSVAAEALEEYLRSGARESRAPVMPEGLAELLRACFREEPGERPQDMREVASALKEVYGKACGENYRRKEPKAGKGTANSLNNWAVSLLDLGKTEQANKMWEEALKAEPHHLQSTYNRNLTLCRSGGMTERDAVGELEQAFKSHPDNWLGPYLLMHMNLEFAEYEDAGAILKKVRPEYEDREEIRSANELMGRYETGAARLYEGARWGANSMSMSGDERYVLCCSDDGGVRLWETATGSFIRLLEGHKEPVYAAALDSCGVLAASGGRDKTIRIWNARTGRVVRTIQMGYEGEARTIAFTKDDRRILAGDLGNKIGVWDVVSGKLTGTFQGHNREVTCLVVSENGRKLLSGSRDRTVRLWDLEDGTCLTTLRADGPILSVALSRDCGLALCGTLSGGVILWDLFTGRELLSVQERRAPVTAVALSAYGRYAVTSNSNYAMKLWDLQTGKCIRIFTGYQGEIHSITFCQEDRFIMTGGTDNVLRMFEVNTEASFHVAPLMLSQDVSAEESIADQDSFEQEMNAAKEDFNKGEMLAAAAHLRKARSLPGYEREPAAFEAWTALYRHLPRKTIRGAWKVREWEGHSTRITKAAVSPDGRRILTGDGNGLLKLWDASSGRCIHELNGHSKIIHSVSFTRDGRRAVSTSSDCSLRIWDLESARTIATFEDGAWIGHSVMTPDGGVIAYLNGAMELKVLYPSTGRSWLAAKPDKNSWFSFSLSPDGRYAVTGGYQTLTTLWDLASGNPVRTFGVEKDTLAIAMSPDGERFLTGDRNYAIELWDASTGSLLRANGGGGNVTTVLQDRDRRYAISGTIAGFIRIWNLPTGECLLNIEEPLGTVSDVAVSWDGSYVVSTSSDGSIEQWALDWELEDVSPGEWDEGARPYLRAFLACHTPLVGFARTDRDPSIQEARRSLLRKGPPSFTESDFENLLYELGCSGYGWLSPSGVRKRLDEMAADCGGEVCTLLGANGGTVQGRNEGRDAHLAALSLMEAGDEQGAMPLLEKAVSLERANLVYRNSLAAVYSRNGQEEKAEDMWRAILSEMPDFQPAKESYAVYLSGKGAATRDISWFQEALKIDPSHYSARKELGIHYQNKGDWENAQMHLGMACQVAPDAATKAELYDREATCFMNLGNYSMAVNSWQWALELKEWPPEELSAIQQDLEKARNCWEKQAR